MLSEKNIVKFKHFLKILLEFGRAPHWIALSDSKRTRILVAELIDCETIEAVNEKNNWDIAEVLGHNPQNTVLIIADMSPENRLLAVFERGESIPEPILPEIGDYYSMASSINTKGAGTLIPNNFMSLKIMVLLGFLFVLLISFFRKIYQL